MLIIIQGVVCQLAHGTKLMISGGHLHKILIEHVLQDVLQTYLLKILVDNV